MALDISSIKTWFGSHLPLSILSEVPSAALMIGLGVAVLIVLALLWRPLLAKPVTAAQATEGAFKYWAFISYSRQDQDWGRWLHRRMETYRVPRRVVGLRGRDATVPKRLVPIFRDIEELPASSDLGEQINQGLSQSGTLIVICSPNSAKSKWVNEEIVQYKKLHRENRILGLIIDGEPNAAAKGLDPALECFPTALKRQADANGELTDTPMEPIAADARPQGEGPSDARLKLIAGVLGISYDALKRRDDARRFRRALSAVSAAAVLAGAAAFYGWQEWDSGYLDAISNAANSVITVDGAAELGSPVKGLKLRSGRHTLLAQAPEHIGFNRTIDIPQQGRAAERFFLENGFNWTYTSPTIQGGLVLIPTADDTLIVHNELTEIVALSARTGRLLASISTPAGNTRAFFGLDLGGKAGRVIVSGFDAERAGPDLLALRANASLDPLWRWQGPASGLEKNDGLAVVALPAKSGPAAVAVAGRDGHIYILAGETGTLLHDIAIAAHALPSPPTLIPVEVNGEQSLAVLFRQALASAAGEPTLRGVLIRLPEGKPLWQRDFGPQWQGPMAIADGAGASVIVLWNDAQWQAVDLASGKPSAGGTLPGKLVGGPATVLLGTPKLPHLVFQFADPSLKMTAVRLRDGQPLWQGAAGLSAKGQLRGPGSEIPRAPNGLLLVNLEDALAAIDPADGHAVWKLKGHALRVLIGDWNGSGKERIFVGMSGEGIVCLDENGTVLWTLSDDRDLSPWAFVRSAHGGFTSDIVVHKHASAIASIHGPHMLWEQRGAAAMQATPAIAPTRNGTAVLEVADWGGDVWLKAFDGSNGSLRWSARERFWQNRGATLADLDGDGVTSLVALGRFPGVEKLNLLSYSPSDGKLLRAVPLDVPGWLSCAPAIADFRGIGKRDVAFTSWDDRSIVMADGRTGRILWRVPTGGPNMQGIAAADLDGDRKADVVAISFDGFAYGLRGLDGSQLWKTAIPGGGWGNPTIAKLDADGPAYVLLVSAQGKLFVLNGRSGEVVWSPEVGGGGKVSGRPLVVERENRKTILAPLGGAGVVAFDWENRSELWRTPAGRPVLASPALADFGGSKGGSAVVAAITGDIMVVDIDAGKLLWETHLDTGLIEADPVVADLDGDGIQDILIAGYDFKLRAISGAGSLGMPRTK